MGHDTITRAQRVIGRIEERRTITIDLADYMDGPASIAMKRAMIDNMFGTGITSGGRHVPMRDFYIDSRQCICCGAPAGQVQHD